MKTEIKVGIFVFVSFFLIFGTIAYLGKSSFSSEGQEYFVTFRFLNDLKTGADVKFAGGILIGYVKKITPDKDKVKVTIWVEKQFEITSNANISIIGEGFLGEKYININFTEVPEEDKPTVYEEGAVLKGKDTTSFGEVLQDIYVLTGKLNEAVDNVNFILGGINRRKDINRISNQAVKLLKETSNIIAENKETVKQLITEVTASSKSLSLLLKDELPSVIRNTNRSVFTISREITELTTQLKLILQRVQLGQGLMGKVISDTKLAKDFEQTILNLKKLSEELMSNPIFRENKGKSESAPWKKR
jgi:phospholipid/cholesterol/gamma-HCH transport system substrate-binding protein